jgi:hypothetical protein
MATYARITGDEHTKSTPIIFVKDGEKYEVICESFDRQKSWYSFLKENPQPSFENFISRFSYQDVEAGEVTPEVESKLNKLRAKYALSQIADQELETGSQTSQEDDKRGNALLRISKRMRTGENEA